jgi:hypothetical protein
MISLLSRGRTAAAVAAGIGALALAASLPAVASATPSAAVAHAAKSHVVIVNCRGTGQIRPSSFVITCADGNDYLTGLHWSSWPVNASAGAAAFGRGSEHVNDCIPNCAQGHVHSFPVLVTLWRSEPRGGHAGQRRITRITDIYSGKRPTDIGAGGKKIQPQTATFHI